jgi:hypothetical protein
VYAAASDVIPFPVDPMARARLEAEHAAAIYDLIKRAVANQHSLLFRDNQFQILEDTYEVGRPQAPEEAGTTPAKADTARTRRLILLIALTWLLAIGTPVVETQMPVPGQAVVSNEIATVALALGVTWRAIDKRKK